VHVTTGLTRSRRTSDTCSVESVMLEQVKSVLAARRRRRRGRTTSSKRVVDYECTHSIAGET